MYKKDKLLLPKIKISELRSVCFDNGLKAYIRRNDDSNIVSVQAWVRTGSVHEGEFLGCGLSHFLEHMLFKGSKKYPGSKIADTVHKLGGDINAYTSYGMTVYHIDLPSASLPDAIDILAEMISVPAFPETAFREEKNVILRERDMCLDNPGRVLLEKLNFDMFSSHPIRYPIIGYRDKISSVDREIMYEYYRNRYSPIRSFFVVSGNADPENVIKILSKKLSSWQQGNISEPVIPMEPRQICRKAASYTFKDPLARIALAYHGPDASHPDIPALDLLVSVLGQNKSSRLLRRLKMETQLAMNVSAYNYSPYFCGMLKFAVTCKPENIEAVKSELFAELENAKTEKLTHSEIQREQLMLITDYLRNLNSNDNLARIIGNAVVTYGSPDYADVYLEDMCKVSADDVAAVAERYLNISNSTILELVPEDLSLPSPKKTARAEPSLPVMKKLPGNQRAIVYKNTQLPLVDICIAMPGGSIFEDVSNCGISGILSLVMGTATKKKTERQFAEFLDNNAIDMNINSGSNSILFRVNCHKNKLGIALSALRELINEAAFPEREFIREKNNAVETLRSRNMNPQNAAEDKVCSILFGRHPYSRPACGTEKSLKSLSVANLKDFYYRRCLNPSKAVLGIAGDIDEDKGLAELESMASDIAWSESSIPPLPARPVFGKGVVFDKVKLPREQAVVMTAMPSCDNSNSDRFCIDILHAALNSQASELFKSVRERAGLAYYTGFYSSRGIHEGFMAFYAGTAPESSEKVINLIDAERLRLIKKGIGREEFASAKNSLYFSVAEQMQNISTLIYSSVLSEYYGMSFKNPWELEEIYRKISMSELLSLSKKYLDSQTRVTVTAGP